MILARTLNSSYNTDSLYKNQPKEIILELLLDPQKE